MTCRTPRFPHLPHPIIAIVLVLACTAAASGQLRIACYNTASLLGDTAAFRQVLDEIGADDKPGFAVAPHVLVFQEVRSDQMGTLATLIAQAHPGVPYAAATYTNFNENFVGGAQALFYRSDMLSEDASAHADIFTGAGRFADRWRLTLNGYNDADAAFYLYSMHLKASTGGDNEQQRLEGVQAVRSNAAALPAGSLIIYAGDMNFYTNTEPGYQAFIAGGNGQAIDPLGTGSWAGPSFAVRHTQSPRLDNDGGLVGGGLDDRFDFQLLTSRLNDGQGLSIIPGTYRALGNDGNHFDGAINTGNNFYYFWDLPRSNALADALHDASDHIPVVADYQLPARLSASLPATFGPLLQGTNAAIPLTVVNTAPAIVAQGADELSYVGTTAGALSGPHAGTAQPLGAAVIHQVPIGTFVPGVVAGAVQVNTSSQGAGQPILLQTNITVLRRSQASFEPLAVVTNRNFPVTTVSGGPPIEIEIPIHALNWNPPQAWIEVTSVEGGVNDGPFSVLTPTLDEISGAPGIVRIGFDPAALAPGLYTGFADIAWNEQPLPGAFTGGLFASINVTVEAGKPTGPVGDLNDDGVVDFSDLLILLAVWGPCPSPPDACDADLDESGATDFNDLLILLSNWG